MMKRKKTYSFALISSVLISLLFALFFLLTQYIFNEEIQYLVVGINTLILFVLAFAIIQYRVERFIYQRVKKIYQSVSLLDIKNLNKKSITSDMETLSEEVQRFAEKKLSEIQNLNEQASFRREFMGNVAHELKTPLFSIQGYLLTLLETKEIDKKTKKQYLKRAEKNVERLVNIVEDLDFIAKMDASKIQLDLQKFDIVLVVKNVFEMLEMTADKYQVSLKLEDNYSSIIVYADKKRIEQVLINLVSNSIKYAKKNTTSTVRIQTDNDTVLLCVNDHGDGIPKEHLPRVFERFYRVESSRSREAGGSGLGLSIVKHIVEAHNQKISVNSEIGKGSSFCFSLER